MAKIIVVDDDAPARRAIVDVLASVGHEAIEAADASVGLTLFRSLRPHLVVTAIVMADMDGLELITALRRASPRVPIIAVCAGEATRRALYLRLASIMGADETLAAPFSASELTEAVERLLPDGPGAAGGELANFH